MLNVRKVLETWEMLGRRPLPRSFARQLLTLPKEKSLDDWFHMLPELAADRKAAERLVERLRQCVADEKPSLARRPSSLTFAHTARRRFEETYWQTIALLAAGRYVNKDNADCVHDRATQSQLSHHDRDLEPLGDYVLGHYRRIVEAAGMSPRVGRRDALPLANRLPFPLVGRMAEEPGRGNPRAQPGRGHSRPQPPPRHRHGRPLRHGLHGRPLRLRHGGGGPRLAAAGADDNHSATATLMLAAPIFLDLARQGKLACDIWLVHFTGEEFPADCMGARHLCQRLVEGTLQIRLANGRWRDLSRARIAGVYLLDMIAHNSDRDRDVFQICPGVGRQSMWLAQQAQAANRMWNASVGAWNGRAARRGRGRGQRSADGRTLPEIALHPALHGEVRPVYNPRSTLFNTDGQIFSDAGVPVVLFMENYDINRQGYHDSHDTMANIDLDYGAAVAAIAIESVARAATEPLP